MILPFNSSVDRPREQKMTSLSALNNFVDLLAAVQCDQATDTDPNNINAYVTRLNTAIYGNTSDTGVFNYTCVNGYYFSGYATTVTYLEYTFTCTAYSYATSYWTGTAPTCIAASCELITSPQLNTLSSQVTRTSRDPLGTTGVNTAVYFSCEFGYQLIDPNTNVAIDPTTAVLYVSIFTCNAQTFGSSAWEGTSPTCFAVECAATTVSNANKALAVNTTGATEDLQFTCSAGYKISGLPFDSSQPSVNTTQTETWACTGLDYAVSAWRGTEPTCEKATCSGSVAGLNNATTSTSVPTGETADSGSATFSCLTGYHFNGLLTTVRTFTTTVGCTAVSYGVSEWQVSGFLPTCILTTADNAISSLSDLSSFINLEDTRASLETLSSLTNALSGSSGTGNTTVEAALTSLLQTTANVLGEVSYDNADSYGTPELTDDFAIQAGIFSTATTLAEETNSMTDDFIDTAMSAQTQSAVGFVKTGIDFLYSNKDTASRASLTNETLYQEALSTVTTMLLTVDTLADNMGSLAIDDASIDPDGDLTTAQKSVKKARRVLFQEQKNAIYDVMGDYLSYYSAVDEMSSISLPKSSAVISVVKRSVTDANPKIETGRQTLTFSKADTSAITSATVTGGYDDSTTGWASRRPSLDRNAVSSSANDDFAITVVETPTNPQLLTPDLTFEGGYPTAKIFVSFVMRQGREESGNTVSSSRNRTIISTVSTGGTQTRQVGSRESTRRLEEEKEEATAGRTDSEEADEAEDLEERRLQQDLTGGDYVTVLMPLPSESAQQAAKEQIATQKYRSTEATLTANGGTWVLECSLLDVQNVRYTSGGCTALADDGSCSCLLRSIDSVFVHSMRYIEPPALPPVSLTNTGGKKTEEQKLLDQLSMFAAVINTSIILVFLTLFTYQVAKGASKLRLTPAAAIHRYMNPRKIACYLEAKFPSTEEELWPGFRRSTFCELLGCFRTCRRCCMKENTLARVDLATLRMAQARRRAEEAALQTGYISKGWAGARKLWSDMDYILSQQKDEYGTEFKTGGMDRPTSPGLVSTLSEGTRFTSHLDLNSDEVMSETTSKRSRTGTVTSQVSNLLSRLQRVGSDEESEGRGDELMNVAAELADSSDEDEDGIGAKGMADVLERLQNELLRVQNVRAAEQAAQSVEAEYEPSDSSEAGEAKRKETAEGAGASLGGAAAAAAAAAAASSVPKGKKKKKKKKKPPAPPEEEKKEDEISAQKDEKPAGEEDHTQRDEEERPQPVPVVGGVFAAKERREKEEEKDSDEEEEIEKERQKPAAPTSLSAVTDNRDDSEDEDEVERPEHKKKDDGTGQAIDDLLRRVQMMMVPGDGDDRKHRDSIGSVEEEEEEERRRQEEQDREDEDRSIVSEVSSDISPEREHENEPESGEREMENEEPSGDHTENENKEPSLASAPSAEEGDDEIPEDILEEEPTMVENDTGAPAEKRPKAMKGKLTRQESARAPLPDLRTQSLFDLHRKTTGDGDLRRQPVMTAEQVRHKRQELIDKKRENEFRVEMSQMNRPELEKAFGKVRRRLSSLALNWVNPAKPRKKGERMAVVAPTSIVRPGIVPTRARFVFWDGAKKIMNILERTHFMLRLSRIDGGSLRAHDMTPLMDILLYMMRVLVTLWALFLLCILVLKEDEVENMKDPIRPENQTTAPRGFSRPGVLDVGGIVGDATWKALIAFSFGHIAVSVWLTYFVTLMRTPENSIGRLRISALLTTDPEAKGAAVEGGRRSLLTQGRGRGSIEAGGPSRGRRASMDGLFGAGGKSERQAVRETEREATKQTEREIQRQGEDTTLADVFGKEDPEAVMPISDARKTKRDYYDFGPQCQQGAPLFWVSVTEAAKWHKAMFRYERGWIRVLCVTSFFLGVVLWAVQLMAALDQSQDGFVYGTLFNTKRTHEVFIREYSLGTLLLLLAGEMGWPIVVCAMHRLLINTALSKRGRWVDWLVNMNPHIFKFARLMHQGGTEGDSKVQNPDDVQVLRGKDPLNVMPLDKTPCADWIVPRTWAYT
uniref:Sushi domain-containing protein n=1 Tax=Chromera velia CCMP2878 TaxID=1169474 RepID=A0A0G4I130_9ALVE|eukprot:Cvel_18.t1-p1 / transcript=Cvel_18.t1 / gene=Cvel_18 / organism=Chromera_velia_CCMP2878 / gene_product=Serine-rich adhesin for platelets, putative / transcript_product=Serine-rich adhesin for platelets, putative / location=Cvel_scaffold5:124828-138542(+) / protein_length=2018 / sequence_SO=supercontig / SO=protein_coding / is_pseudo=false